MSYKDWAFLTIYNSSNTIAIERGQAVKFSAVATPLLNLSASKPASAGLKIDAVAFEKIDPLTSGKVAIRNKPGTVEVRAAGAIVAPCALYADTDGNFTSVAPGGTPVVVATAIESASGVGALVEAVLE